VPTLQHCVAAAVLAAGLGSSARAAELVDFDEFDERFQGAASFVSGPLTFSSDSGYLGVEIVAPANGADNGTPYLVDARGSFGFARSDGQAFVLDSFDIGQSWFTSAPTASVTVSYDRVGGGTTSETLTLTHDFSTFARGLAVTALRFDLAEGSLVRGYVALDNITISAVPEPATWASFALGLAVLGAARRRRPG
jgi:hypothetical protein